MNRAWSTLQLKAASDAGGKRTFSGIASTINTDRMDDIVVPKGAKYSTPFPFLWQHDSAQPIGWVKNVRTSAKQIEVDVELHNESEPGALKDRLDEAWQSIKAGLVRGMSIGFNPIKTARIEGSYGYEIQEWDWLELSAVTIPANADCSITSIKSADRAQLAATGRRLSPESKSSPGASGTAAPRGTSTTTRSPKGTDTTMKTLTQLREERTTKAARFAELADLMKAGDADEAQETEFDALEADIKSLDSEIRVARVTAVSASSASAIRGASSGDAARSRGVDGGMIIVKTADAEDKFKGQGFVRALLAKAAAFHARKHGDHLNPADFAQKRWGKTHPQLVQWIKANEVAGGGTGSGEWGAELIGIDNRYNGDFVNFLYSRTVYDQLGLRQAPKNVSVKGQDGAAVGYWVGESKGIPVSKPDFSTVNLTTLKAAGICIASKELLADSDPAAEMLIRDSLVEAIAQRIDTTFLSATAASAGVSPAGILNGVSALHTTGTDEAAVRTMIKALYSGFITDKNASDLVLVMAPGMAKAVGLIVNALGQTSFPGLGASGGVLLGDRVVTGDNVDPSTVLLIKPRDIWQVGDEGVQVSMSDSAMLEQNSAPTGATDTPVAASVTLTSMFQEDSVAIKVVRRTSFQKRRTGAVAYVDDADFDGTVS